MKELVIGGVYKHFKEYRGDNKLIYVVRDVAEYHETGDLLVIYQALYPPYKTYARPLEEFLGLVDPEKHPYAIGKDRFTLIHSSKYTKED